MTTRAGLLPIAMPAGMGDLKLLLAAAETRIGMPSPPRMLPPPASMAPCRRAAGVRFDASAASAAGVAPNPIAADAPFGRCPVS